MNPDIFAEYPATVKNGNKLLRSIRLATENITFTLNQLISCPYLAYMELKIYTINLQNPLN